MNDYKAKSNDDLINYQAFRLKSLINEMVKCCDGRKLYESQTFGLPYAELKCLMLFEGERYLTGKGIAQRLDVAKSRVTKLINGLLAKDMVKEVNDPSDGRIKLISLTSEGQKKSNRISIFQKDIHQKILFHLSAQERKTVLSDLELLRSAMEAVKEQLI